MGTPAALSPVENHGVQQQQQQQQHHQQLARSSKASSSSGNNPEDQSPPPTTQQQLAPAVSFAPSSNVTAEMRKRGATTTHRGSLPLAFEDMNSLHAIATTNNNTNSNNSNSNNTNSHSRRSSRATDVPSVVLDRRLLQRYEEINSEIAQLSRLSRLDSMAPTPAAPPVSSSSSSQLPPASNESDVMLRQVTAELRKARRSSSQVIQSQKELLEKLERQEKSSVRRFFSINKDARVERIKSKLCDKLTEAAHNDSELVRLERQSDALARTSLANTFNATALVAPPPTSSSSSLTSSYSATTNSYNSVNGPLSTLPSVAEVDDELATLQREKEDVLNSLFASIQSADVQELHARIASYACEIHACQSIRKQVDRCATMYRQALTALSKALATIVSPQYSNSIREFAQHAYPLAIEASHLIEAAAHGIQPESRRRYDAFAPALVGIHPPKFPQAVVDYARRARTNSDPHSQLALEAVRKLRAAENVLMLLQRLVIEKAEVVDNWKRCVERDQVAAERGHALLERRLQEHVAVLARSVSV